MPEQQTENLAIVTGGRKPLLMETMAEQYGLDPAAFKSVLLKTVFPQDKIITMEQLAMFCVVAHKYKLNVLLKELYAFPNKNGGIIPIIGVDGWIRLVQDQPAYDGEDPFEYEWTDKDGNFTHSTNTPPPGVKLHSVTATLYRKDRTRPTRRTAQMSESARDTPMWKQMPVRMLEHRAYILAARYAFGFGGLYDQDDADRILEGKLTAGPDGTLQSTIIKQPQRIQSETVGAAAEALKPELKSDPKAETKPTPAVIDATLTTAKSVSSDPLPDPPAEAVEEMIGDDASDEHEEAPGMEDTEGASTPLEIAPHVPADPPPAAEGLNTLFEKRVVRKNGIGDGRAKRIRAILHKHKVHTEEELRKQFFPALGIEHLHDLPTECEADVVKWAEGRQ